MRRLSPALACLALLAWLPAAHAATQVYKWVDENGVTHYTDTPPKEGWQYEERVVLDATAVEPMPADAAAAASQAAKPTGPSMKGNCEIARKNVDTLTNSPVVTMDRDGDGASEALDTTQRAAELARAQDLVKVYCTE